MGTMLKIAIVSPLLTFWRGEDATIDYTRCFQLKTKLEHLFDSQLTSFMVHEETIHDVYNTTAGMKSDGNDLAVSPFRSLLSFHLVFRPSWKRSASRCASSSRSSLPTGTRTWRIP